MPEQHVQNLTLVFVDIPTIGAIREQQGEVVARDCQQRCLALLSDVRKQYSGNLVRAIGGTLLCSFADAANAVGAGVGMHRAIVSSGLAEDGVSIRMGMHAGPVQIRSGNYSGEVVTSAARMVTLARNGCIVATASVREQAGERLAGVFTPLGGDAPERLKMELFEVNWTNGEDSVPADEQAADAAEDPRTRKAGPKLSVPSSGAKRIPLKKIDLREVELGDDTEVPATSVKVSTKPAGGTLPPDSKLCLIWHEKVLVVDAETQLRMGREDDNDIVLQVHTASRWHASVCFRDGSFILTDASANGTFIYDGKGEECFVQDGEAVLGETGAICPGCPQEEPGCEALLYWMAG